MGQSLVLDRVETPVAGQQIRCPPEALLVRLQARAKLGALRGALRENLVTTDDAPVYLVEYYLASELPGLPRLVAGDDPSVLLEVAKELLGGR
jgi:hypothetical protein